MSEFNPNDTYHEITFSTAWQQHRDDAYVQYRQMWDEYPRTKHTPSGPIHLDIETTTRCNLKCPMCPRTMMIEAGTFGDEYGFMSFDEYTNLIDQAVDLGVKSVKLNYLGEPLLHKDVVRQVRYAKDRGIIDVIMNTNGTALTGVNANDLLMAGVDGIFISIDAVSPRLYEQQRVGADLGRVIDNVYRTRKLRDEIRPGCQLRVSMVMYDGEIWAEQFRGLVAMFRDVVDAVGWGRYVDHTDIVAQQNDPVEDFWCAQLFQRMFIKFNGNATVCCVDSADELTMGSWREQSLADIWRGPLYEALRATHRAGQYHTIPACARCYLPCARKGLA